MKGKPLVSSVLILILISISMLVFFNKSASKAMEVLELGSSYDDLIAIAGPPDYETDGTRWVEPEFDKPHDKIVNGCVREVWYNSIFCFFQISIHSALMTKVF